MNSIYIRSAVRSGLLAGLVFLILEMILVPLFLDRSPWTPIVMMSAIILGEGVLPPPEPVNFLIINVGLLLHLILSLIYTWLLGWLIMNKGTVIAILMGTLFGMMLYLLNFNDLTGIFPWFVQAKNWVTFFSHAVFGGFAAYLFVKTFRKIRRRHWKRYN